METLSTLKFAQRAKFIQNNVMSFPLCIQFCFVLASSCFALQNPMKTNLLFQQRDWPIGPFTRRNTEHWIWLICIVQAVVNEDASGEMIALRREIQRLKVSIVFLSNWRILHHPTIVNLFLYYCFLCDPTAKINIYMWIWKQEELNSLRSQTLSSMRRERRRESDEFFRLSITPKAIFSPAPEDRLHVEEDEPTLTTEELLEKVLHMNLWNNSHHQTIRIWSHFLRITTTIFNTLLCLVHFTNVMTHTKSGVRWHRSKHWRLYWQEPWDEN